MKRQALIAVSAAFLEEEIDIGIQIDRPQDGNVIARALIHGSRIIIGSPAYLARHPAPKKPGDLLEHDCARLVRGRHVFDHWIFREDGHLREVHVQGSLLTSNSEVMHQWALEGRALTIKASWDVEEDVRAGRLVHLLKPYQCDDVNLYATYASRSHLPPRMRLFIDFLVEHLHPPGGGDARDR